MADPKKAPGDPTLTQREAEAQAAQEGVNKPESSSPGDPRDNLTHAPATATGPTQQPGQQPAQPAKPGIPPRGTVPGNAINTGTRPQGQQQSIPAPGEQQATMGRRPGQQPQFSQWNPADMPAGFHHTPALAQAGVLDLVAVVQDVRELSRAIRDRDWPTVFTVVGRLSMYAASIFGQNGVFSTPGVVGGNDVGAAKTEFDRAADEFGQARAQCYSYAPRFVGAGEEQPAVQFDPASILVALELAAKIIAIIQQWRRNRTPVAP
jgi:hypothetical protein